MKKISNKKKYETELIQSIFSCVDKQVNPTDVGFKKKFKRKLEELFAFEMELMGVRYKIDSKNNDIEFNINNTINASCLGDFSCSRKYVINEVVEGTPKITLNLDESDSNYLYSNDINRRRSYVAKIVKVLLHEIKHFRQYKLITNDYSYDIGVYNTLKEYIIFGDSENSFVDRSIYKDNHDSYRMEADANLFAYNNSEIKPYYVNSYDIFNGTKEQARIRYTNVYGIEEIIPRDKFITDVIDKAILHDRNLYLLEVYPLLKCEYNYNCTRKTLLELYNDMKSKECIYLKADLFDSEKLFAYNNFKNYYYELINRQLFYASKNEVNELLNNVDQNTLKDLFMNIRSYNNEEAYRISRLVEAKYKKIVENDISNYTIKSNMDKIEQESNSKTILIDVNTYIDSLNPSDEERKILNHLMFKKRIPSCGYYLLRDYTKISPIDYVRTYILPIKGLVSESEFKTLDFNKLLYSTVFSTNMTDYYRELEYASHNKEIKNDIINSVISELDKNRQSSKCGNHYTIRELLYGTDEIEDDINERISSRSK